MDHSLAPWLPGSARCRGPQPQRVLCPASGTSPTVKLLVDIGPLALWHLALLLTSCSSLLLLLYSHPPPPRSHSQTTTDSPSSDALRAILHRCLRLIPAGPSFVDPQCNTLALSLSLFQTVLLPQGRMTNYPSLSTSFFLEDIYIYIYPSISSSAV